MWHNVSIPLWKFCCINDLYCLKNVQLSSNSLDMWVLFVNSLKHVNDPVVWRMNSSVVMALIFFSCDQAALWMVQSVRLSVCPSVCPSVCLSHLFDYVPIILSSWNFQELLPVTKVTSMQNVKVRGQRSRSQRSRPKFSFPDCNSSLNSHMMMKWYI